MRINRTRPGTGVAGSATDNSACALINAKASFASVSFTGATWTNATKLLAHANFVDVPVGSTVKFAGGGVGTSGLAVGGAGYVVDSKPNTTTLHLNTVAGTGDSTADMNGTTSGIHAYYPSWHDFAGLWSEMLLDFVISPTNNMPLRSVKDDFTGATTTILEVGGVPLAEVTEYFPQRGVLRFRDLNDRQKIKCGDSVTLKLWRRPNTAWESSPYYQTTFTAPLISSGPRFLNLAVRAAMSGDQDGTCIADFRGLTATLYGRRSN
jgi:hypothetical protein